MRKTIFITFLVVLSALEDEHSFFAQNKKTDSLLTLLNKDKEDTNKVLHLNSLGWQFRNSNPDTSIILARQTLTLSEKLCTSSDKSIALFAKRGIANSFGNLGVYYRLQGNYDQALDCSLKAARLDEELGNKSGAAKHFGNAGLVYQNQANFTKALDYYFKALKIDETLGNNVGIARHLGNIGNVYYGQGDYTKALEIYVKALKLNELLKNKIGLAKQLGNIGNIYSAQAIDHRSGSKERDQANVLALQYYTAALRIGEELEDNIIISSQLTNIGSVYSDQLNYTKALENYLKALKTIEKTGNKNEIEIVLANIGSLYLTTQKYKDAYTYIYRALALSNEIGSMNELKENYELLSDLYEKSTVALCDSIGGKILSKDKMRLKALHYFKIYVTLSDTIFSMENKKQLIRKEMNYDFEKKEAATKSEQEKKDALAAEELKQKEQQRNYFIAGFALVALLALFIFKGYRQKQKDNIIITEQKKHVDEHQKEILDSIRYARRIQTALLPNEKYIEKKINKLKSV